MLAVLIVLMGGYAILRTPTDIFPNIRIPIAAVIWRYSGILPEEIANRIVLFSERIAQTTVNDVEHTESQSVNGVAVVKYFFQPDVDQDLSFGQITAVSQTQLFFSPPEPARRSSCRIAPRACRFCSSRYRATACRKRRSTMSGTRSCAPSLPPWPAHRFPSLMAGSSGRFRWISTRRRCAQTRCRPTTWSVPSASRI